MPINSSSTKKDLIEYLRDAHGVNPPDMTKEELLRKCAELDDVEYESLIAPGKSRTREAAKLAAQPKRKIRIASTEEGDGKSPVFVAVNGVSYLIQRDVDVEVPESVIDVLNNAKRTVFRQIDNQMVPREVHTYPFSIVA